MPDHPKKTNKRVVVGMEITRSRATVVLVDHYGKIHHRFYAKTLRGRPAIATLEPYLRTLETALSYAKSQRIVVSGLGISIPGTLDLTARCPGIIPILPSLNGFPLCDLLEARYNLPVQLHAEQAYVGHACHVPVSMSGPRCSCGKYGCINALISLEAIQKMVQRALRRGEQTSLIRRLMNREHFSPQLLAEEALHGDPVALHVYCEVGRWIGAATARYINIYEPDVLILGGDVLGANELLIASVQSSLMLHSPSKTCARLEIVPSSLGSDAALIGAGVPFLNKSLTEQIESA